MKSDTNGARPWRKTTRVDTASTLLSGPPVSGPSASPAHIPCGWFHRRETTPPPGGVGGGGAVSLASGLQPDMKAP